MWNPETREALLNRAAEGEPLDDGELRDLGAALVADPNFAEEFLLARRIAQDAPQLARTEAGPRAGFAGRVMAAVALEPMPRPAARLSPRAWAFGAAAAVAAVATGLAFLPGAAAWSPAWTGVSGTASWAADTAGSAWSGTAEWLTRLDGTAIWARLGGAHLAWTVPLLVAVAGALNLWMARRSAEATGERHRPR